jgi:hypothetical protein
VGVLVMLVMLFHVLVSSGKFGVSQTARQSCVSQLSSSTASDFCDQQDMVVQPVLL